jgi:hypothetical protein
LQTASRSNDDEVPRPETRFATSLRTRLSLIGVDTLRGATQPIRDPTARLEQFRDCRFEHVLIQAQALEDQSHLGFEARLARADHPATGISSDGRVKLRFKRWHINEYIKFDRPPNSRLSSASFPRHLRTDLRSAFDSIDALFPLRGETRTERKRARHQSDMTCEDVSAAINAVALAGFLTASPTGAGCVRATGFRSTGKAVCYSRDLVPKCKLCNQRLHISLCGGLAWARPGRRVPISTENRIKPKPSGPGASRRAHRFGRRDRRASLFWRP